MKPILLLLALVLLPAPPLPAAEKIESGAYHYSVGPAPAWVRPVQVPPHAAEAAGAGQSVRWLLSDRQIRLGPQGEVVYRHIAFVPLNEDGLADSANIQLVFNPEYQALTIHAIDVVRNGRRMDKLRNADIKLLQRETDIERRLYDGTVTAFLALDDVRLGDRVEYAYSIQGSNPVFGDKHFSAHSLGWGVPVDKVAVRLLAPAGRRLHWRVYNMELQPRVREADGYRELIWAADKQPAVPAEGEQPRWYQPYPWLQLSEYEDWQQVVDWARELYRHEGALHADLQAKANAWQGLDRKEAAAKALQFVQQEVRYFGVELGQNSHRPRDPNDVYRNRYGDCKDKALLLTALLQALGIQARPALVSMEFGKAVAEWLPSPGAFDHVIVAADVDGRRYWLDPTRSYQHGALDRIDYPDFGVALPVAPSVSAPVAIAAPENALPAIEVEERFTVESYDQPVHFTVKTTYSGREAERQRYYFSNTSREEIGRKYLNFYARSHPAIRAVQPVRMDDDRALNRVVVDEAYRIPQFWTRRGDKLHFELEGSTLHGYMALPRTVARTTPLALTHPIRVRHKTLIVFPEAIDFEDMGEPIAIEDEALRYTRVVGHEGRRLWIEHEYRSKRDAVMPQSVGVHLDNLRRIGQELYYAAWVRAPEDSAALVEMLLERLEAHAR